MQPTLKQVFSDFWGGLLCVFGFHKWGEEYRGTIFIHKNCLRCNEDKNLGMWFDKEGGE